MRLRVALHVSLVAVLLAAALLSAGGDTVAQSVDPAFEVVQSRYSALLADPLAQRVANSALAQASQALRKSRALAKSNDPVAAARSRLLADAAITLAARQNARARVETELRAAERGLASLRGDATTEAPQ